MPFLQSLFPCFGSSGGEQEQHSPSHHDSLPSKRKEGTPRTSSNTSAYATPIPVSEAPGSQKPPLYHRPDTKKKLPPQPPATFEANAFELPGSSPDLYEMPATHVPGSHPLARPSNAASPDLPRQSQQSERAPLSPYSPHSTLTPTAGSVAGSIYKPSGSVRAPSERDPDEICPVQSNPYDYGRGAKPNMYSNVTDALTDRKRMFERLRKGNGVEGQANANGAGAGVRSASQSMGAVTPVEMEAPMHQPPQTPMELATTEHTVHARNPSGPREME